ncbi:prephenate dehydrogenase [Sphaerobacter thermophilus]|jgi:prephenate dehydrogenase|uniref:prephenate dehydrogenase n=1 Tax=Sphaerobacter thermophilus TaxID=2057 RepID=UPI000DB6DC0C|nr:MAG: prephenate dehydrogenase/arogenate dehydrogenase family protein [Sphaerobacter thermophilus]
MQRVSIIGLGLIGASIGLGLKRWATDNGRREPVLEISGFDVSLDVQNYAKKLGAVDRTEWNLPSAIERADFIVIATPVGAVREVLQSIAEHGRDGVVVTDTGSTKAEVLSWAAEILPPTIHFVGGHPMAGKTQSVEGAEADLFKQATWAVCPTVNASEEAVQTVLGMISALDAEPLFVDAHEHDGFVAAISHLPMLLSVSLMRTVRKDSQWRDIRQLSSSGFRDVSRLAGGSPEMYRDICATNRENIVRWVDTAIADLQYLRDLIATGSEETLETLRAVFEEARDARADWVTTERRSGGLVQDADKELTPFSMGEQMQQMLFGSLFRRKPRTGREPRGGDKRGVRPERE